MTTSFNKVYREYTTTMNVVQCADCGVPFGLSETHHRSLRASGDIFCCPNGHRQSFTNTDAKRIKELEQRLQWSDNRAVGQERRADAAERSLSATKGVVTKMKKRAAAGVCPYCSRTFQNLARHMNGQHPEYGADDDN